MKERRRKWELMKMHEGCLVVEYIYGDQLDKEEMDQASMTHGNYHSCLQQLSIRILKGREPLENLGFS
jgi:hypothetical protein